MRINFFILKKKEYCFTKVIYLNNRFFNISFLTKISEKASLRSEQTVYCSKKTVTKRAPVSITLTVWEVKNQMVMKTKTRCALNRAN